MVVGEIVLKYIFLEFSVQVSDFRLGFCVFKLMPQNCHSHMFLAGIQDERATWIPDKGIRV